jgi:hypothetical protein
MLNCEHIFEHILWVTSCIVQHRQTVPFWIASCVYNFSPSHSAHLVSSERHTATLIPQRCALSYHRASAVASSERNVCCNIRPARAPMLYAPSPASGELVALNFMTAW